MRSPREIAFRLRQEGTNLLRFLSPPALPLEKPLRPVNVMPDLAAYAPPEPELLRLAEQICAHRFPIFGKVIETGAEIDWHCDYVNNKASGNDYFRRLPYLDFNAVGDHKWIWELNRHQHLVLLAQAWKTSDRAEFVAEIEDQLSTWFEQNPFGRGMNWASALEVAFRALSWSVIDHLAGDRLSPAMRLRLQNGLWEHALHLESNLSVYFSPNTHLLGEAIALFAIGTVYPELPGAKRFAQTGARITEQQLEFQMRPDGSHFEQSTYYHVYAVDFFVFYYLIAGRPPRMEPALKKMAAYLDALLGPARRLFFLGDDDGGRLFFPYGDRATFGLATIATCDQLFPDVGLCAPNRNQGSTAFADSGMVSLIADDVHVLCDGGPFGWGGAGHSHADTLNVLIRKGATEVLRDPGTYTYIADVEARNWHRGTAAHNTIRIDGLDQAVPTRPFRWDEKPQVNLVSWNQDYAEATCEYRGFKHHRRVWLRSDSCVIVDDVTGPAGEHTIEQFWNRHPGYALLTDREVVAEEGWQSDVYGSRRVVMRDVVRFSSALPVRLVAAIVLDGSVITLSDALSGVTL